MRTAQTYSRPEANRLVHRYGQPLVHAGGERYVMLSDALLKAGPEPTLELIRDKRSLLLWPEYLIAGQAALLGIYLVAEQILNPDEVHLFHSGGTLIDDVATLHEQPNASQPGRLAGHLAVDLQRVLIENQIQRDLLDTVPRTPEEIERMLNVMGSSTAVSQLLEDGAVDTGELHLTVSSMVNRPRMLLEAVEQAGYIGLVDTRPPE